MASNSNRRRTLDAQAAPANVKQSRRQLSSVAAASNATASDPEQINVVVPKAFKLTLDHHHHVEYPAGSYPMPREHAEHWWSKASGVTQDQ